MGYDDNGLPTERLVERRYGIVAEEVGRKNFIERCLELSAEIEREYEALWRRLGLSIDWRFTYRTIDEGRRWCRSSVSRSRSSKIRRRRRRREPAPSCAARSETRRMWPGGTSTISRCGWPSGPTDG
ncbi:MAG: hypothetical protein DLM70_11980 [Chloroflexi bacterium]|nr:MAG: hypothetical protein DLM70_11980 [Chloroflexota bacterium]